MNCGYKNSAVKKEKEIQWNEFVIQFIKVQEDCVCVCVIRNKLKSEPVEREAESSQVKSEQTHKNNKINFGKENVLINFTYFSIFKIDMKAYFATDLVIRCESKTHNHLLD